ncbi:hypothetical protein Bca52824_017421 [Brassica carinata]|uniref:Uncharacterized protein n=1 Tax=Brassica carinata TaxID=52824 RepID=A0A8X7VN64_BRACI|nr:hypothetical protein Bca52824_017421 [Brassica carinata]
MCFNSSEILRDYPIPALGSIQSISLHTTINGGARLNQKKIQNFTPEEKAADFGEVLPHGYKLMTDVFGNYVIQKINGGARLNQKKIQNFTPEEKAADFGEVLPHGYKLMTDVFGNYVIQKEEKISARLRRGTAILTRDVHNVRVMGGPIVSTLANAVSPLYFEVTEAMEDTTTGEPCDITCVFGDGLLAMKIHC